jgi:hypothetical protein
MSAAQPVLDMDKLNAFVGQFVLDLGAAVHSGMVVIGEKLGLYKALAEGPMNSIELATKRRQMNAMCVNGCHPRQLAVMSPMTKRPIIST